LPPPFSNHKAFRHGLLPGDFVFNTRHCLQPTVATDMIEPGGGLPYQPFQKCMTPLTGESLSPSSNVQPGTRLPGSCIPALRSCLNQDRGRRRHSPTNSKRNPRAARVDYRQNYQPATNKSESDKITSSTEKQIINSSKWRAPLRSLNPYPRAVI